MRRRILLAALVLLLAIPLAFLLRDFAQDVFLVELGRVLWSARILFESLPQLPIWGLLLVTLLLLALRSLAGQRRRTPAKSREERAYEGQVQRLSRWIQRSTEGEYFRWRLAQHLADLTWQVMAQHEGSTPHELQQRLRAGRLDLPPVVQRYLESSQAPLPTAPLGWLSALRRRLESEVSRHRPDPALDEVVQFLEDQVERQSRVQGPSLRR